MVSAEEKEILLKVATGELKSINLSKATLYQRLAVLKVKFGAVNNTHLIYLAVKSRAIAIIYFELCIKYQDKMRIRAGARERRLRALAKRTTLHHAPHTAGVSYESPG